jgi:hypothetical protein
MDNLLPLPKGAVAVDTGVSLPQGAVPINETAYDRFINNFQLPKMDGNRVVGPMLAAGTGELIKGAGALTELAFPETGRNIARLGDKITSEVKEQYPVLGTTGQIASYALPFSAAQKAVNVVKSTPQVASRISNIGKIPSFALAAGEQSAIGAGTGYVLTPNIENRENAALFGAATGPIGEAIKPLAQGAGYLGKQILGLSTGAGADAVGEAFKAGAIKNPQFLANLRGKVPAQDILQQAQSGLQTLKAQRKQAYQEGIGSIKPNQEIVAGQPLPKPVPKLDFNPIETAFKDSLDNFKIQGGGDVASTIGKESFKDINKIKSLVDEWKSKKGLHTAEGLDGLKRRIDDVYRNDMSNEAKSVLSQTRNTVKDTIIKQDATYAKTMRDYEASLGLERELEQALKLGDRSSIDSAIRSLQSLTRNNANTSYQYRQQLADILKQKSGVDLMPALSGQALNSVAPRGIQKLLPSFTAGGALTGAMNLGVEGLLPLVTLPLQSPRVVGESAYMAGKAAKPFINLANSGTQEQRNLAKLLMMKAAQQGATNE